MSEESKERGKKRRNVGGVFVNREVSGSRRVARAGMGNGKFGRNELETSEGWTGETGQLSWRISVEL
jgi:hypothetical protein